MPISLALLLLFALAPCQPVSAQDDVVYRRNGIVQHGKIVSYDSSGVRMRTSEGKESLIPADQIERVAVKLTPEQQEGEKLYEQRQYRAAVEKLEAAFQAESRQWMRARLASNVVACYFALGDSVGAIEAFFAGLKTSDGQVSWSAVPVWWLPEPPDARVAQHAATMLRASSPLQQVIGASFLFGTDQSAAARETLAKLTTYPRDERLAQLARTQLWRWDLSSASADDVASWQRQASKLPADMRGGPAFTIGLALKRLGKHEDAALALLWPALVYRTDPKLSGRALLLAAESLEAAKPPRAGEAKQLYQEVIDRFGNSPEATTAQARLNALKE